jgi:hypothetical protein
VIETLLLIASLSETAQLPGLEIAPADSDEA